MRRSCGLRSLHDGGELVTVDSEGLRELLRQMRTLEAVGRRETTVAVGDLETGIEEPLERGRETPARGRPPNPDVQDRFLTPSSLRPEPGEIRSEVGGGGRGEAPGRELDPAELGRVRGRQYSVAGRVVLDQG